MEHLLHPSVWTFHTIDHSILIAQTSISEIQQWSGFSQTATRVLVSESRSDNVRSSLLFIRRGSGKNLLPWEICCLQSTFCYINSYPGSVHTRSLISPEFANTIGLSLIAGQDYLCYNALLYRTSFINIAMLRRVQNNLARVVCCIRIYHHCCTSSTGCIRAAHFINSRTSNTAIPNPLLGPANYQASLLARYEPMQQLWSSNTSQIKIKVHKMELATWWFSSAALFNWNSNSTVINYRLPFAIQTQPGSTLLILLGSLLFNYLANNNKLKLIHV